MAPSTLHTMTVDPKMLLRSSETLAYNFASYAAAENDAKTLRAFLEAGLDPTVTSHAVKRRGDDKMVMNPWLKAVENDAVDCVRLMMEFPGANVAKLLSMHPEGRTGMDLALLFGAKEVLALWREKKVKIKSKGNNEISNQANLGSSHALGLAAMFGDEGTVRWLLGAGADDSLKINGWSRSDKDLVNLDHFLAWGNCAQILDERLKADPHCARRCKESFSRSALCFHEGAQGHEKPFASGSEELHYHVAGHRGVISYNVQSRPGVLGVVHREFAETFQSFPAAWCPMSPISCAILGEATQALNVFVKHLGREVVDAQAQFTLNFLRNVMPRVHMSVLQSFKEEHQVDAQIERAIAACERWVLGAAGPSGHASAPGAAESQEVEKPRRRAVRL